MKNMESTERRRSVLATLNGTLEELPRESQIAAPVTSVGLTMAAHLDVPCHRVPGSATVASVRGLRGPSN